MAHLTSNYCQSGHPIINQSCSHCKQIQKHWYQYLHKLDFIDIEKGHNFIDHKTTSDLSYRKDFQTKDQYEARLNYFSWASEMLETRSFRSFKDQLIWEYHSEGLSRRKISERIGLGDRWCSRKIIQIREYLMMSTASQCAMYA